MRASIILVKCCEQLWAEITSFFSLSRETMLVLFPRIVCISELECALALHNPLITSISNTTIGRNDHSPDGFSTKLYTKCTLCLTRMKIFPPVHYIMYIGGEHAFV